MQAEHFLNYVGRRCVYMYQLNAFKSPDGLGCCPLLFGGSVVVDFCLLLLPLWESVIVLVLLYVTLCPL